MSLQSTTVNVSTKSTYRRDAQGRLNDVPEFNRPVTIDNNASTGGTKLVYGTLSVNTTGTTLNLKDNTLKENDGTSFAPGSLVEIYIEKDDDAAGQLVIGGGTAALAGVTGFADPIFHIVSKTGIPVTVTTADRLKIAASVGTIKGNYKIVGRA